MAVITTLKDLVKLNPLQSEAIKMFLSRSTFDDPGKLADFSANLTTASGAELQEVLETFDVRTRIDRVLVLLKREVEISKLHVEINKQIQEKISGQQREFFLKEQLKAIKKEFGLEKEGKTTEIEKFQERLKDLTLNAEAKKAVEDEMDKFQLLEPHSPEYTVSRNYLDWLTALPWGKFSQDSYDVEKARQILDRDHYGLDDVKDRILEFIAVGKLKGDISGSILCLVGPPGVGKTSVGKSIADALGRHFFRFSLGGMRDEAEIKGHRRTYIGAMPGKFLQAMKTVGTSNPSDHARRNRQDRRLVSGRSGFGAARSPGSRTEQQLPGPLSRCPIRPVPRALCRDRQPDWTPFPGPLLDRMEVIRLSGYISEEKQEIARRYLIPKTIKSHGLKEKQVSIRKDALTLLIENYARESGVRNLENLIKKISRKTVMEIVRRRARRSDDPQKGCRILSRKAGIYGGRNVRKYAGRCYRPCLDQPGRRTLQIEATAVQSRNKGFKQTGQLGAVMVESADIAYSYVMAHLEEYGAKADFFDERFVHIHVPAGATPKDGPSAGVTMATALLSMILQKPVRKHLAMTGELTLTGQVLPIGGVKEKVIAARRVGCKILIFPEANRKDFEELPDTLRRD